MSHAQLSNNAKPVLLKGMSLEQLRIWCLQAGQPAYRGAQLFDWLYKQGVTDPAGMGNLPSDFRAWLAACHGRGLARTSVARALSVVRGFFRRLAREGHVVNPALATLRTPRVPRSVPKAISAEEAIDAVETVAELARDDWIGKRDTAILTLLYGCGLRIGEALALTRRQAPAAGQGDLHPVQSAAAALDFLLAEFPARGIHPLLCWDPRQLAIPGLAQAYRAHGIELIPSRVPDPDRQADFQRLEPLPLGLTAADAALARTGSIILHADRDQGRLASLLPPVHYALLPTGRIYPDLAAWLAAPGVADRIAASSNTIIITGPSRTADIAQTLTLGAHGPKEVHVILIEESVRR